MYQISGSKFEQVLDSNHVGVFDASRSYFVVFTQQLDVSRLTSAASSLARPKHAIYLWMGSKRLNLTA